MERVLLVAFGYLAGSVPFGVIVTKFARGVDVRQSGSGNIGATNVARVAGKKLGVLVLLLDALKGAVPVLVAMHEAPQDARLHAAVGVAAFLGHVFPIWLKLRGGKGVATALGVLIVLVPYAALAGFATYAVLFAIFRISSVGSLAGALVTVTVAFFTAKSGEYAVLAVALLAMMIFTHRGNIGRLLRRTESKL